MTEIRGAATRPPRVSVVIPTQNRPTLLRRAVTSVLNQTFGNVEVIVVDDCSADDGARRLVELDNRLRYIRHDVSRGACAARNTGIRLARGEYLAFLDDDDEWLPEKLERQVDVLERASPDVGVVYTGVIVRTEKGRRFVQHATVSGDVYEALFGTAGGIPVNNVSLLVRKTCFDQVGLFDEELVYGEAWDLYVRLARRWEFAAIKEPLAVIHWSQTGVTGDPRRVIAGRRRGLEKYRAEIEARRRCHSGFRLSLGVLELKAGNVMQARREFALGVSAWPLNGRALAYWLLSYLPRIIREACISFWRRSRPVWQQVP